MFVTGLPRPDGERMWDGRVPTAHTLGKPVICIDHMFLLYKEIGGVQAGEPKNEVHLYFKYIQVSRGSFDKILECYPHANIISVGI